MDQTISDMEDRSNIYGQRLAQIRGGTALQMRDVLASLKEHRAAFLGYTIVQVARFQSGKATLLPINQSNLIQEGFMNFQRCRVRIGQLYYIILPACQRQSIFGSYWQ